MWCPWTDVMKSAENRKDGNYKGIEIIEKHLDL